MHSFVGYEVVVESHIIDGLAEYLASRFPGMKITIKFVSVEPCHFCKSAYHPRGDSLDGGAISKWAPVGQPIVMVPNGNQNLYLTVDSVVRSFVDGKRK